MAFTRSKYGIANYAAFNRARVTIYIEGKRKKNEGESPRSITYDEAYYRALFLLVLPEIPVTFVVLGSKADVLAHSDKIESEDIRNAVTIIDLDTDFLKNNPTPPRSLTTYGYSWENDFWTKETCAQAFKALAPTAAEPQRFTGYLADFIDACSHALAKLSKVDVLSKIHGEAYLPGDKPGIEFKAGRKSGISSNSLKLNRKRIPLAIGHSANCDQCRLTLATVRRAPFIKVVQGHRWEHFCLHKMAALLKSATNETHNHSSIKAAALTSFSAKTAELIDSNALRHYQQAIPDAVDFSLSGTTRTVR